MSEQLSSVPATIYRGEMEKQPSPQAPRASEGLTPVNQAGRSVGGGGRPPMAGAVQGDTKGEPGGRSMC